MKGTFLNRIFLLLTNCLFIIHVAANGNEKARVKVPQEVRTQFQKMWKQERAEKISQATAYLGISFAASYAFGLMGLAGYYNWTNTSFDAYCPLFFNISLAGAALTWHYRNERNSLISKKRLSKDEIHAIYVASLRDPKQRMNHV